MKRFTVRPVATTGRPIRLGGGQASDDWGYLGRLAEAGPVTRVLFDLSQEHVVAIVGKRGSGKSYTLGSLLEALALTDHDSPVASTDRRKAVLLFDTLGIFQWMDQPVTAANDAEEVKRQYKAQAGWNLSGSIDVDIWRPREAGDNPARPDRELVVRQSDLNASDWAYLLKLDLLQDRMGQLLGDAFHKVTSEGWFEGNLERQPNPGYGLSDLIACVNSDPEINGAYQSDTRRAVAQQLTTYSRNPVFGSDGVDLRELLRPGHLSVVVMNRMTAELRFALITSIVRRIMRSRMEASESEKELQLGTNMADDERERLEKAVSDAVPPTWIAADEAQNFLPTERGTAASEVLVQLVREGRNMGLSFVITTQQPSSIDQRIMAQVDLLVAHQLSVQTDIDHVRRNLKSGMPDHIRYGNHELGLDGLLRELDVGQAVVSCTEGPRTLIIDVRPRLTVHGGF